MQYYSVIAQPHHVTSAFELGQLALPGAKFDSWVILVRYTIHDRDEVSGNRIEDWVKPPGTFNAAVQS